MMGKFKNTVRWAAGILVFSLLVSTGAFALEGTELFPEVSAEMTESAYWAEKTEEPDAILADSAEIEALNAAFLACEDCNMIDLLEEVPAYDGTAFQRGLLQEAMQSLSEYLSAGYYNAEGLDVPYTDMAAILEAIDGADTLPEQEARYGVCVSLADVRAVPTEELITDAAGDNDFDMLQLSYIRVNEPVIIRAETAGGEWYYCESVCVSGWVSAEDIAVCANREEWLDAWSFPVEEALVVTEGRVYLDESNVNAASSRRMLTMGTVLRRVDGESFDAAVTNRAGYHNYAVYLPVREADGSYGTTIALIPQHSGVSEGYLPLTVENVMEAAFSMLGDAYGWGGMLSEPDCSLYIRNIYKCFGLELPRNTTWQAAMPALKYDLSELDAGQKTVLLDELPAGAILFFNGHEMLYLGEEEGLHYVISTVSSMLEPEGEEWLRVRSVVVNTLEETRRANGNIWIEDLNLAVIPYLPEETDRTAEAVVEEIVTCYGCYGGEADERVQELLEELSAMDARQGELWTEIMAYWTYANTEMPVNTKALPEDLPEDDSLCIIVLGFELNDDGTMQKELTGRLKTALVCAEQYPNAYVVCTGGGTARDNPDVTEAGLMGEWLLKHGLEEERLIIEDQSLTTAENANFSYGILLEDYPQVDSVAIVSSSYHIAWGSLLFEAAFLKSASENQTPEIHVISNCGYPIENDIYKADEILRWETGGMLQLIGDNELAMQYYFDYGNVEKPVL